MNRPIIVLGVAAFAAAAVAGCSPEQSANLGLAVDASGDLLAQVKVCSGEVSVIDIYATDNRDAGELLLSLVRSEPLDSAGRTETINVAAPSSPWSISPSSKRMALDPSISLLASARNEDRTNQTPTLQFTIDQIETAGDGQVVTIDEDGASTVVSESTFAAAPCRNN